jgi:hypothetical protein
MNVFFSEVEDTDYSPTINSYLFICRRFSSMAAFRPDSLIFCCWLSSYAALSFELLEDISLSTL